jgi:predicted transcriptional regulator
MDQGEIVRDGLLLTLAERYESDPTQFVNLPKQTMDSSLARAVVAELRNEGLVKEQARGIVRLTLRGYQLYKNHLLACCCEN